MIKPIDSNDPSDIFAWLRLDHRITTSGQPSAAQLADIAALGVGHVINLALHSHEKSLPDEPAVVAALGMNYIHIPVDFNQPTEDDFAQFCHHMAAIGDEKVHVHCIINARVSAFFYRYHRDIQAMAEPQARAAMEKIWQPGNVWAAFIGDVDAIALPHRGPVTD